MRKSLYQEEIALQVVFLIRSGVSLREACEKVKLAKSTFLGWIKSYPMLQVAYTLAKKWRKDRFRAEIAAINKEIKRTEEASLVTREQYEPGFIFRCRQRIARKEAWTKIKTLRLRRDLLKWELGRMTARAR